PAVTSSAPPLQTPPRGTAAIEGRSAMRTAQPQRPVLGAVPMAREGDGRALPRAYVARRRSSPKGVHALKAADELATPAATTRAEPTGVGDSRPGAPPAASPAAASRVPPRWWL